MDTRSTCRGGGRATVGTRAPIGGRATIQSCRRQLFTDADSSSSSSSCNTWLAMQEKQKSVALEEAEKRWAFNFNQGRPLNNKEKQDLGDGVSDIKWEDCRFLVPPIPLCKHWLRGGASGSFRLPSPCPSSPLIRSTSVMSTGSDSSLYSSQSAPTCPLSPHIQNKYHFRKGRLPAPKKMPRRRLVKRPIEQVSNIAQGETAPKRSRRLQEKARGAHD